MGGLQETLNAIDQIGINDDEVWGDITDFTASEGDGCNKYILLDYVATRLGFSNTYECEPKGCEAQNLAQSILGVLGKSGEWLSLDAICSQIAGTEKNEIFDKLCALGDAGQIKMQGGWNAKHTHHTPLLFKALHVRN